MEREPGLWLADTKRLAVPGTEPFAKLPRPVAAMMYIVKNHIGNSTKTYVYVQCYRSIYRRRAYTHKFHLRNGIYEKRNNCTMKVHKFDDNDIALRQHISQQLARLSLLNCTIKSTREYNTRQPCIRPAGWSLNGIETPIYHRTDTWSIASSPFKDKLKMVVLSHSRMCGYQRKKDNTYTTQYNV